MSLTADSFAGFSMLYLSGEGDLAVPKFHKELYHLIPESKRLVLACPRYHGKSTIGSIRYPLFAALEQKAKDIIILSATHALAKKWLSVIDHQLRNNKLLIEDYGDQYNPKGTWNQEEIHLRNGVKIRAKGRGFQIRGEHPDLLIVDDLEDDEKVKSPDQRDKLEEWWWKVIEYAIDEHAQLIMLGTVLHPESLLAKIVKKEGPKRAWDIRVFKALQEDETALWPEKVSAEALLKERENNPYAFESERQNNPISDHITLIKPDMVRTYESRPTVSEIYMAIDPAFSEGGKRTDKTAIAVLGVAKDGLIYDVGTVEGKWNAYETVRRTKQLFDVHRPKFIGLEAAAQKVMSAIFQKEAPRLPIVQMRPDKDKRSRLESVIHMFCNGQFFSNNKAFWAQALAFPTGQHDDMVDAVVYGLKLILQYEDIARNRTVKKERETIAKRRKRRDKWIRGLQGQMSVLPGKRSNWVKQSY